jgi:hypothetical protein
MLHVVPDRKQLFATVDEMSRVEAARFFVSGTRYPRFLYKFVRGDRLDALTGFVVSSTVWLSSTLDFNDPFDLRANIHLVGNLNDKVSFVAGRLRKLEANFANHPDKARARAADLVATGAYLSAMQQTFETEASSFGIACFASARPPGVQKTGARDILMWSHYALDHKGLCLQFHTRRSPSFFASTRPVEYKDELISINWRDRVARGEQIFAALYRKSPVWAHENEYRLSLPSRSRTVEPFRPEALVGIVFGCRAKPELVDTVTDLCAQRGRAGLSSIRLFRACQATTSYRLRIKRARDLEARCGHSTTSGAHE